MTTEDLERQNSHLRMEVAQLRRELSQANVEGLQGEINKQWRENQELIGNEIRLEAKLEFWKEKLHLLELATKERIKPGVCESCGVKFDAVRGGHKKKRFCSDRCRKRNQRDNAYNKKLEETCKNQLVTLANVTPGDKNTEDWIPF